MTELAFAWTVALCFLLTAGFALMGWFFQGKISQRLEVDLENLRTVGQGLTKMVVPSQIGFALGYDITGKKVIEGKTVITDATLREASFVEKPIPEDARLRAEVLDLQFKLDDAQEAYARSRAELHEASMANGRLQSELYGARQILASLQEQAAESAGDATG